MSGQQEDGAELLAQSRCTDCPTGGQAFCALKDPATAARLEEAKRYRRFTEGEIVVLEGYALPYCASVITGTASMSRTLHDGRQQMVGLLFPADFIAPDAGPSRCTIAAASALTLCTFTPQVFAAIAAQAPQIGSRLLQLKTRELDQARDWMVLLGRKTARERVASLLYLMAARLARPRAGRPVTFELPLTRAGMADLLGLTTETVSRQMTALRADGVLHHDGGRRLLVPDLRALLCETGDDQDGGPIA